MIVKEIAIHHFGKADHVLFSGVSSGVNLFYGQNESGKTTLMQFVRAILFGFSAASQPYLNASPIEKNGGMIVVQTPLGEFRVERHAQDVPNAVADDNTLIINKKRSNHSEETTESLRFHDEISIHDAKNKVQDPRVLEMILANTYERASYGLQEARLNGQLLVDDALFSSVFAIGLHGLHQLALLQSSQLTALLYHLSTGLERNSLPVVLSSINQILMQLLTSEDRSDFFSSRQFLHAMETEDSLKAMKIALETDAIFDRRAENQMGWILRQMLHREITLNQLRFVKQRQEQYIISAMRATDLSEEVEILGQKCEQAAHQQKVLALAIKIRDAWEIREKIDSEIISAKNGEGFLFTKVAGGYTSHEQMMNFAHRVQRAIMMYRKTYTHVQITKRDKNQLQIQIAEIKQKLKVEPFKPEILGLMPKMEAFLMQEERAQGLVSRISSLKESCAEKVSQMESDYMRLGLTDTSLHEVDSHDELKRLDDLGQMRSFASPMRECKISNKKYKIAALQYAKILREKKRLAASLGTYAHEAEIRLLPLDSAFTHFFAPKKRGDSCPQRTSGYPSGHHFLNALSVEIGKKTASIRRQLSHFDKIGQNVKEMEIVEGKMEQHKARMLPPLSQIVIIGVIFIFGMAMGAYGLLSLLQAASAKSFFAHLMQAIFGFFAWIAAVFYFKQAELKQKNEQERDAAWLLNLWTEITSDIRTLTSFSSLHQNETGEFCDECEKAVKVEMVRAKILEICQDEQEKLHAVQAVFQKELVMLEEKSILASKHAAFSEEGKYLEKRALSCREQWLEAKAKFRAALEHAGFPGTWKLRDVMNFKRNIDRLKELWRRLRQDEEDRERYAAELSALSTKMKEIVSEMSTNIQENLPEIQTNASADAHFMSLFPKIREKLHEQVRSRERIVELQEELHAAQKNARKLAITGRKLTGRRRAICRQYHVKNGQELKAVLATLETLNSLYEKRSEIQRKIDAELNFHCDENAIWEVYQRYMPPQLELRVKIVQQRLAMLEAELAEKKLHLAELQTGMKELENDHTCTALRFDLAKTEQNILSGIRQWRTLALTQRLIEAVKKTYEQKRQPETLNCASDFLKRMTDGKYVRVWTPVDEDILRVDREDGRVFSVEQLSTGTCELLFLALRLALIQGFRRQNLYLPVFFDDLLVNFDKKRASLAVDVLCDFFQADADASGGQVPQIFVFTCHEHIKALFMRHDVNLCEM